MPRFDKYAYALQEFYRLQDCVRRAFRQRLLARPATEDRSLRHTYVRHLCQQARQRRQEAIAC